MLILVHTVAYLGVVAVPISTNRDGSTKIENGYFILFVRYRESMTCKAISGSHKEWNFWVIQSESKYQQKTQM